MSLLLIVNAEVITTIPTPSPILIDLNNLNNSSSNLSFINISLYPELFCTPEKFGCVTDWINVSNPSYDSQNISLEMIAPSNISGMTLYFLNLSRGSVNITNKVQKNGSWIERLMIPANEHSNPWENFAFKVLYHLNDTTENYSNIILIKEISLPLPIIIENLTNESNQSNQTNTTLNTTNTTIPNNTTILNNTNLSIINQTLGNILNNLTNDSNYTISNNSICHSTYSSTDYNITVNGTNVSKIIELSVNLCYNESMIYCYGNGSRPESLFRVNLSNLTCRNEVCKEAELMPNPYNITDQTFDEATAFLCMGKKVQDGWSLWAYKAINLYSEDNIFYFDFSNSSFITNDYNVTNTTVYNITNNITNDIINNITNNFTYVDNITNDVLNNITANLSWLEARVAALEEWRIQVDETLRYLINIIDTINKLLEKNIFLLDFSGSHFTDNQYAITNETIYNITNNITRNITNNETNNFTHIYNITNNITNNITAEDLTNIETRVTNLEVWKEQVNETLNLIMNLVNNIVERINALFGKQL
jgi:hypothetical protein